MGKILVIASFVISLATIGLGIANKGKLTQTAEARAAAESQAAANKKQADASAAEASKAKDELATATAEKEQAVAATAQAKADLDKAAASLTEATAKATAEATRAADLETQLNTAKQELAAAGGTGQPAATSGPDPETLAKLQEQETLIQSLQQQLDSSKATTKELVQKDEDRRKQQLKKGTEGRILAVNPAWNFVVLSLGDKHGVANNTELLVKRGTRYLGKVRITSVEPSTSIADIVANSMPQGVSISPGDHVIFRGNDGE